MVRDASAVIAAALIGCAAWTAAPAAADLSPAPALAPGIGIATYAADRVTADMCTAGWLVHDADGQPGLLTAGHCYRGGGAAYVDMSGHWDGIGRFTEHVHEGSRGEDSDIALVGITFPVPTDTRVLGIRPTASPAATKQLAIGQTLCKVGATTGRQCGPIRSLSDTKVHFGATGDGGDSGGPVYLRNADGTATPVGITIRGAYTDDSAVAELIGPWLDRWHLTVDTTPGATAAPVQYHR